jgi:hypothetical protein
MTFQPNQKQWRVIWTGTALVLGMWLISAPWADLAVPTPAEQQRIHEKGREARERTWQAEQDARNRAAVGRSYSPGVLGDARRRWDEEDDRQQAAMSRARLHSLFPDYRGETARTEVRNRLIVSVVVVGLLLVWRFADKTYTRT